MADGPAAAAAAAATAAAAMLSFQGTCAGEKTKQNKNKTDPHPKKKQPIITHHETAFCAS